MPIACGCGERPDHQAKPINQLACVRFERRDQLPGLAARLNDVRRGRRQVDQLCLREALGLKGRHARMHQLGVAQCVNLDESGPPRCQPAQLGTRV